MRVEIFRRHRNEIKRANQTERERLQKERELARQETGRAFQGWKEVSPRVWHVLSTEEIATWTGYCASTVRAKRREFAPQAKPIARGRRRQPTEDMLCPTCGTLLRSTLFEEAEAEKDKKKEKPGKKSPPPKPKPAKKKDKP